MGTYDDALSALASEYDVPEDALAPLRTSKLRQELAELAPYKDKYEAAERELANVKKQPVREAIFKELGVDLAAQSKAHRTIAEQFDPEVDGAKEAAAKFIEEWGFQSTGASPDNANQGAAPAAAGIVNVATSAPNAIPDLDVNEQIQQAEAKGDFALALKLKTQKQLGAAGLA